MKLSQIGTIRSSLALVSLVLIALAFPSTGSATGLLQDPEFKKSYFLAQLDGSEAYDPFVDYSEFDEASDEEADINFFRNGRFFTLGLAFGNRFVTGNMAQVYTDSPTFGLLISYFFDLRFAMHFSFISGSNHNISVKFDDPAVGTKTGSSSISAMNLSLKYYMNTQNVTKGLAKFNPYFVGGFAKVTRKTNIDGVPDISEDSSLGFEAGAGIEFPLLRNKMFFGLQATYLFVTFGDENTELKAANNAPSGITPAGDFVNALAVLGINF